MIERVWLYLLQKGLAELATRRRRRRVITFGGLLAALDPGEEKPLAGSASALPRRDGG